MDGEQAVHASPLKDSLDGRLGRGQLDLALGVPGVGVVAEVMERVPARLEVVRRLAVEDADDRVEGDQPGAGEERQAAQVQQDVAGAAGVELADVLDQALVVLGVQLALERDDRDRDTSGDLLGRGRQRH